MRVDRVAVATSLMSLWCLSGCNETTEHEPPTATGGSVALNYQPSQPTGCPPQSLGLFESVGKSVGGNTASQEFLRGTDRYRISLLHQDPVFEGIPEDPTIEYQRKLEEAFGTYYTFNYVGGFYGKDEFNVRSYTTFVREPTERSPLIYGADIFVVYTPDLTKGDPGIERHLKWIQVVHSKTVATPGGQTPERPPVDNRGSAHPFWGCEAVTSIYGNPVVTFTDTPQEAAMTPPPGGPSGGNTPLPDASVVFMAEVFLAEDTLKKDTNGKEIINIFGGFKWGYRVEKLP